MFSNDKLSHYHNPHGMHNHNKRCANCAFLHIENKRGQGYEWDWFTCTNPKNGLEDDHNAVSHPDDQYCGENYRSVKSKERCEKIKQLMSKPKKKIILPKIPKKDRESFTYGFHNMPDW